VAEAAVVPRMEAELEMLAVLDSSEGQAEDSPTQE
jgi:hypothetical protein